MTYPIETEVHFEYRVPNKETGGETPLWVVAVVTDHGPDNDLPFPEDRYTTDLQVVLRGARNELSTLRLLESAGYDPKPIEDIVDACERRAFDQWEAMRAHVSTDHQMPTAEAWREAGEPKQPF